MTEILLHGVKCQPRKGESLRRAYDRAKLQLNVEHKQKTFYFEVPERKHGPVVVGMDYEPIR